MAFKVERYKNGFKISIGTGKTFYASSLEGVAYGLQHYFRADLFDNKFNYQKHIDHSKECSCCPLCGGQEE